MTLEHARPDADKPQWAVLQLSRDTIHPDYDFGVWDIRERLF